jgi:hypothetical protein
MRTLLVALTFVGLGGIQVKAQVTVKDYTFVMTETQSKAPERRIMETYLKGMGDGMLTIMVATRIDRGLNLFCPRSELPIGLETFKNILDREIKREATKMTHADLDGTPISEVLLQGLQVTFPCKGK